MPRKRKIRSDRIGYEPDLAWAQDMLEEVVRVLNGPKITISRRDQKPKVRRVPHSEMEVELRRLVATWVGAERNLNAVFQAEPALEDAIKYGKTTLYAASDGRAYLDWEPLIDPAETPQLRALYYFVLLITNPLLHRFCGPCPRCKRFYLNHTRRSRKFCSSTCGAAITAAEAVKRFRERQAESKTQAAQMAIVKWRLREPRKPCKLWVAEKTGLTLNWLTIAERKGALRFPDKKGCK